MKKYALLVGVEEYRDKMISPLNFARADAEALAGRLRDRCNFDQVRVLADDSGNDEPLLVNIVTALRDISGELHQEDLFLFFFAGHGIEKEGHGYLLARDSIEAFPEHGSLSLELLRKTLERFQATKRILLLDACRNSPDAGRGEEANRMGDGLCRDIVAAARAKPTAGATTCLLTACGSGQRAREWPEKGHGAFTHFLLEGLDGAAWRGDKLDFDELAAFTHQEVSRWSSGTLDLADPQVPWYEKFGAPAPLLLAAGRPGEADTGLVKPADSTAQAQRIKADAAKARRPLRKADDKTVPDSAAVSVPENSRINCIACSRRLYVGDLKHLPAHFCPKCKGMLCHYCTKYKGFFVEKAYCPVCATRIN